MLAVKSLYLLKEEHRNLGKKSHICLFEVFETYSIVQLHCSAFGSKKKPL